jgi:hypothetical protein
MIKLYDNRGRVKRSNQGPENSKPVQQGLIKEERPAVVIRRELMQKWIDLVFRLRLEENTSKINNKSEISSATEDLRNQLSALHVVHDKSHTEKNRLKMIGNERVMFIFTIFWKVLSLNYVNNNILSKEGYIALKRKFFNIYMIKYTCILSILYYLIVLLYRAFIGKSNLSQLENYVESDWRHDIGYYGKFDQVVFFDLMFELIETWLPTDDIGLQAAFAWQLLDSVINLSTVPPKLKIAREVDFVFALHDEPVSNCLNSF